MLVVAVWVVGVWGMGVGVVGVGVVGVGLVNCTESTFLQRYFLHTCTSRYMHVT